MEIKRRIGRSKKTKYLYQRESIYFAQIPEDIKDAGMAELASLGAEDIAPAFRGIRFKAEKATMYKINYCSRLISRCLAPLASFECPDTDVLYRRAKKIDWDDFILEGNTFAVFANVSESDISHSKYAALRLKDAIADHFREKTGRRPDVSPHDPDVPLNLHIYKNVAEISLDTSGGALHRRGYREEAVSAPMQETLAAAIIHFSGWDGSVPLYDPMCGSGTLLCEALMHYCRIPAGIFREKFGFQFLPDFYPGLWRQVREDADEQIREVPEGRIAGSDFSQEAVTATKTNLMGLHHGNRVAVCRSDFADLSGIEDQVIVTNPPYGIRMGKEADLNAFYRGLGDFLKQKCKGSTAYIYFGDRTYAKKIGLKPAWKKPLTSGGLDGRLVKFELF